MMYRLPGSRVSIDRNERDMLIRMLKRLVIMEEKVKLLPPMTNTAKRYIKNLEETKNR